MWLASAVGCGRVDFDPLTDAPPHALDGNPADAATADLVLFLPFNNTFDDVGRGHTATCAPTCPGFAAGHAATGAKFDGTACLRFADVPAFDLPTFTVSVWVDAVVAGMGGAFVSKPFGAATSDSWRLAAPSGGGGFLLTTDPGGANQDLAITHAATAWQHLAGTYDGTTTRLYLNGIEQASAPAMPAVFDGNSVYVGCDHDAGANTRAITGTIDDVAIYGRALSAAEVAALAAM